MLGFSFVRATVLRRQGRPARDFPFRNADIAVFACRCVVCVCDATQTAIASFSRRKLGGADQRVAKGLTGPSTKSRIGYGRAGKSGSGGGRGNPAMPFGLYPDGFGVRSPQPPPHGRLIWRLIWRAFRSALQRPLFARGLTLDMVLVQTASSAPLPFYRSAP